MSRPSLDITRSKRALLDDLRRQAVVTPPHTARLPGKVSVPVSRGELDVGPGDGL